MATVATGLEVFLDSSQVIERNCRVGLLCNQASINSCYELAIDLFRHKFGEQLTTLFSPQHGLWGEQQANMIETPHAAHTRWGIPIYSLYSETRRPTVAMLDRVDCLVIDLQDIGTRVYTFIWTMLACMQACAQAGKRVIVLDRPNPLGGSISEGPMLAEGYQSFVGNSSIPLRHGLTIAELARLFHQRHTPELELECVPMQGWRREMLFPDTGLPWVLPSPNMPRFETAVVYPGQVLLEGTNLSEGRGTTFPFEFIGAPFIDSWEWLDALKDFDFPGIHLRPVRFRPVFDKWHGESCSGLQIHLLAPEKVRSVTLSLTLIATCSQLYPQSFQWLPPPYEYEYERPPIDILTGSSDYRNQHSADAISLKAWQASFASALLDWSHKTAPYALYPNIRKAIG